MRKQLVSFISFAQVIKLLQNIKLKGWGVTPPLAYALGLPLPARTVSLHNLPRCHVRQNAYYRNLKWTFKDRLSCCCYVVTGQQ